ncbi:MAG: hypothetical protein IKB03_03270 [Tidjanibacter sp.]|nr:hypothetical protein [Tidjanibacter sp.]
MKNVMRILMAASLMLVAAACNNELDENIVSNGGEVELVEMTITAGGETRTTIAEDGKSIIWTESDVLAIHDGTAVREFTIVEGSLSEDGKTASFTGSVAAGATDFWAVYPYSSDILYDGENVIFRVPTIQVIPEGEKVDRSAIASVAHFTAAEKNFAMKNVVGFLQVNITREDIREVYIEGNTLMGGGFTPDGNLCVVIEATESTVTILPANGDSCFAPGNYYMTLLPQAINGLKVAMVGDGKTASITAQREVIIPRNGGFIVSDSNMEWEESQGFVIDDADTFLAFMQEANMLGEGEEAVITADIDLTGINLPMVPEFRGVLNGGGFSLKGWKSEGAPLFGNLYGTVKNLTIDSSCDLTPETAACANGFIANIVHNGGVIDGVVNNASVELVTTSYGSGISQDDRGASFGMLAGECYGIVRNCTNNGSITITSTPEGGDERSITYIGGLVGMISSDATMSEPIVSLSGNTNNGDISYTINGRGGYLFMGGVAGGSRAVALDDFDGKGLTIVEGCYNTGKIYHTFTQEIIGSGNAKSNYINMAGVIGYCIGSVTYCSNGEEGTSKGLVQLAAPCLETGDGYSAAGVSVAGVSCYAYDLVEECYNYGKIDVDGSFGPGYETYPGGGNREDGGTFIAGVVAQVGAFDTAVATHKITNCSNFGEMDIDLPITSTSGTNYKNYHYVGGVVAYANAAAFNLYNKATIDVFSQGTMNYLGGVIGQTDCDATDIGNNGDINFSISREGGNQLNNGNQLFGGVVGYNTGDQMTRLTNNNPVTLTVDNTNQKIRFGGVAGSVGNSISLVNYGEVTLTDKVSHAKEIDLGGVSGASTSGDMTEVMNYGAVNYSGEKSTGSTYVAGVVGYSSSKTNSNMTNEGAVSIKAEELGTHYAAGVLASASGAITDASNIAAVSVDCPTTKTLYLAGVTGSARSATECRNATNDGNLSAAAGATLYMAGIAGHSGGNVKFYDCTNVGSMTFNAPELDATELNAAGICARPYAKSVYDNCSNSGAISVTAKSASKACYAGGIAAQTSNATSAGNSYDVEGCSVKGDITISCPATWYVGGAIAYGSQWSSTATNHRIASNNTVECDITLGATTQHYVGGLIGHSGVHTDISGNSYKGTITVGANDASKLSNVGGLVGGLIISQTSATSTMNAEFALSGNSVEAEITYDAATGYAGLLVGSVANIASRTSFTNYSQISLSYDGDIIKNGCKLNDTAISADNYKNYLLSGYDYSGRYEMTVEGADSVVFE